MKKVAWTKKKRLTFGGQERLLVTQEGKKKCLFSGVAGHSCWDCTSDSGEGQQVGVVLRQRFRVARPQSLHWHHAGRRRVLLIPSLLQAPDLKFEAGFPPSNMFIIPTQHIYFLS